MSTLYGLHDICQLNQHQRLPKTAKVPDPRLDRYTSDLHRSRKSVRSELARENRALLCTRQKAEKFLKHAPVFKADLDLDSLTTGMSDLKLQQDICDRELGQDQPSQVFSGQWIDRKGVKIAFYLAERWADDLPQGKVSTC